MYSSRYHLKNAPCIANRFASHISTRGNWIPFIYYFWGSAISLVIKLVTCPTASDRNGMERCVVSCISRGLYRAVELWSCAPYLNSCPVAQILSPPPPTACNQPLSAHPHTFHINRAYTDGYIICVYIRV